MACLSCGADRLRLRRVLSEQGNARIVRCEACALVQLDPLPSSEVLERLYGQGYFAGIDGRSGYEDYANQEEEYLATFREDVERIREFARGERVLDVGCGYGYFVRVALEAGFDAYGVDLSEEGVVEASRRLAGRVFCGRVDEVPELAGAPFDVLFASHLIEHITEPAAFLQEVLGHLAEDGILVLVTPNVESWLARVSGRRWVSFKIPEHVAYYSPDTLRALLERAGLEVLAIDPAYQFYRLPFLMSKVRELLRPLDVLVPHFEEWSFVRERMIRVTSGSLRIVARKRTRRSVD